MAKLCGVCHQEISSQGNGREFDGQWYHNKGCIEVAIERVAQELMERRLEPGDVVNVVNPGWAPGEVTLEPAVLIKKVANTGGWTEKWLVSYLRNMDEPIERNVSPAHLIKRRDSYYTIPADSDAL